MQPLLCSRGLLLVSRTFHKSSCDTTCSWVLHCLQVALSRHRSDGLVFPEWKLQLWSDFLSWCSLLPWNCKPWSSLWQLPVLWDMWMAPYRQHSHFYSLISHISLPPHSPYWRLAVISPSRTVRSLPMAVQGSPVLLCISKWLVVSNVCAWNWLLTF